MTSLLIDAAVTTLMHDRLRILHDALERKQNLGSYSGSVFGHPEQLTPVIVTTVERQVRELARRALALLESGPRGPVAPGAPRTGDERTGGTSKFALLGSAGVTLPSWSDLHGRRRQWITQILRSGSPDPSLAHVVAPATELAFAVVDKAVAAAGASATDIAAARAFGIGMIGGLASDVIVGPLLRGAEGDPVASADDPVIDARRLVLVESAVRRHVFGGISSTGFVDYFPAHDTVPEPLVRGYLDALAAPRMPLAAPRPLGFSDFEASFRPGAPLDVRSLRQAYHLLRASSGSWDWWQWALWLLFFTAPLGVAIPVAATISDGSGRWQVPRLFRPEGPSVAAPDDEAWSQLALLSFATSSVGPAVLTAWLWGDLPEMSWDFAHGTVAFVLDAVGAILLRQSVVDTDRWSKAARFWPVAILALSRAVFVLRALFDGDPPSRAYFWFQTFPLWSTLLTLIFAAIANAITDDGGPGNDSGRNRTILLIVWPVVLIVVQLLFAIFWFSGKNPLALITGDPSRRPRLEDLTSNDAPYALAALLDESTLWSTRPDDPPSLLNLRYPPGNARVLLRLWWGGDGELQIKHAGHRFSFRIGNTGAVQELALPPVAFTPRELATWLTGKVTGRPPNTPGPAGGLQAVPAIDDTTPEAAHRLPWPMVVADTGQSFIKVGRDRDHAYELRHASRGQLATPHGQRGPAATAAEGWPVAPGPGLAGADGTGVGLAAELGTLLSLGAASRMHDGTGAPAPPPALGPVAQVFRRWNLDARRVNEWRMLVGGGARSEKRAAATPAPPAAVPPVGPPVPPATETLPADDAQLPGSPASPAVLLGSEALCNQLGWVPLFRSWARIAADPEQDAGSDQPAPYNPRMRAEDGRWIQPTNRQLSDAVRYLLDLA